MALMGIGYTPCVYPLVHPFLVLGDTVSNIEDGFEGPYVPEITARMDEYGWNASNSEGGPIDLFWDRDMSMTAVRDTLKAMYPDHKIVVHGNRPIQAFPAWMRGYVHHNG